MKLIRKCVLAALATVALVAPINAGHPTPRPAAHPATGRAHVRYYYVYYRASPHYSWSYYGYTTNPSDAQYYVNFIRYYGYESFYR